MVIGCKNDDSGEVTPGFDRSEMLEGLADQVIIPAYSSLNNSSASMNSAVQSFVSDPNQTTLTAARQAFQEAWHTWQRAAFWDFGPAFNVVLMSSVNTFPTSTSDIENHIANGTTNFNTSSGQDEKGFPAIDYLLYGAESDDALVALYTADANAQNRKNYLLAVAEDIADRTKQVFDQWDAADGNYRATFIAQDGTDVGSSVGLMVNELNKYFEQATRDKKIGIPLGKRSQGIPIPGNVEAYYSGISISLAQENLEAIRDFYMGTGASEEVPGFYDYLAAIKAQYNGELLADAIKDQFEVAIKEVREIPSPYSETVETNPAPANEAYLELQKMVILLKADMPSALGVLITYQDNDGD